MRTQNQSFFIPCQEVYTWEYYTVTDMTTGEVIFIQCSRTCVNAYSTVRGWFRGDYLFPVIVYGGTTLLKVDKSTRGDWIQGTMP